MRYFSFILLALLSVEGYAQTQPSDQFILVKKKNTITIHERWIDFPKSNPPIRAREVKGEFFYRNTPAAGLNLIRDDQRIYKWQSHVSEFKVYPSPDTTTWLEYSYHDIPWPVSDQDHLLRYRLQVMPGQILYITFESYIDNKLAPEREDVTRMTLSGSWTLQPVAGGTQATYRILSMPSSIPKWLTDPVVRNNMMSTIESFIKLVEPRP